MGPRFEVVDRFRPFELVSPGFVALSRDAEPGRWERSDYSPPAPFVTVEASVSPSAAPSPGPPVAPSPAPSPAPSAAPSAGLGAGPVRLGLAAANGDHLLAVWDPDAHRMALEISTGGVSTTLASRRVRGRVRRVAFTLCENQPTALVETGRGWRPVVVDRQRVAPRIDFRVPETLARFTASWQVGEAAERTGGRSSGRARGAGAEQPPAVRAGLFGMSGLRDLHVVQHADGTPYLDGGRLFFTATCAGLGFFEQAHWGVFAFDPAGTSYESAPIGDGTYDVPGRLEQTGHLFSSRDGLVLGDHAGQLVRDGDTWLVAVSSWGDFDAHRGTHVRHTTSTADLLHGVHLLETEPTPLPTDLATYDPGMTRIDGRWHVSYVQSPSQRQFDFHPALAAGPADVADWTEKLELVGADTELHQCEGPVLARLPAVDGEQWRLLASDGHARRYRVYDLAMHRLGDLDAPYGTNIPHPQVVETPRGERLIVTFDGTQYAKRTLGYGAHGNVLVMREA